MTQTTSSALVPVSIIGGYLGAGKTTYINRILTGDHGQRLTVLVNDFGAINIDASLIASTDAEMVTLENGCVCCSIADSLGDSLDFVLDTQKPDHIVIEASGVADPAKIANYGLGWPGCRLGAVVVLADADAIRNQAQDQFVGELVVRQLRSADRVLLSKADIAGTAQTEATVDWIYDLTGLTPIVVNNGSASDELDNVHADPSILSALRQPDFENYSMATLSINSEISKGGQDANQMFETFEVLVPPAMSREKMEATLSKWPESVVRVKGIVELCDANNSERRPCVVQRVGVRVTTDWWTGVERPPTNNELSVVVLRGQANELKTDIDWY